MTPFGLVVLRWLGTGLSFAAAALVAWATLSDPHSWPHRFHLRYVTSLDRQLKSLFLPTRGRWIFIGQLFALEAVGLSAVWLSEPWLALGVPVAAFAPALCLKRLRIRRVQQIEKQLDAFMLTLANSLRATPSLGNALGHTERLLAKPMSSELGLALQEMRVGSSVDQALLNLGGRVQSAALDSAMLAVLIGRQIGGDLTRVLETTAGTLREMARLRGVLRSKTAEAKAQMWVLALIPLGIVYAFKAINPGYFDPLLASWTGGLMIGVAVVLWLASLLVARQVLSVRL